VPREGSSVHSARLVNTHPFDVVVRASSSGAALSCIANFM